MARRRKKARKRAPQPESSTAPAVGTEARRGWLVGLFLLALAIRVAYVLELTASPLSSLLLGDALSYHSWAQRLAAGDWIGSEVFYQAPAYPYFLGLQYAVFGESLFIARLSQALLGALACVLLAAAGSRWLGPRVGLVAGALFAVFAPAVFFVGLIQKTILAVFLFCALLWVLSRARPERDIPAALGAGALLGALALTRENALVLVAPVLLWLVLEARGRRSRLLIAASFAAGLALLLAPVVARNYHVSGELHLTTSQMGPNLFIGNNPDATGYYRPLRRGRQDAKFERTDANEIAEEALGRSLTPAEVSSYYVSRVVDYVRSQPGDWARLMARKLALVCNATEIGDTEDLYAYASRFRVLALFQPLHFGLLLPLAAAGLLVTWSGRDRSHRRGLYLLHALMVVYVVSVVAFYVFSRYRFPIAPMVLLFAAGAIVEGVPWFRSQTATRRGLAVALVALVLVGSNWPMVDEDRMRATTHYNLGYGLAQRGETDEAIHELGLALSLDPDFVEARTERAVLFAKLGREDEAAQELERAVTEAPRDVAALTNLAELDLARDRPDAAESHFTRVLELDPKSAAAHSGLARIYFGRRELEAAEAHFRQSLALAPKNPSAHNNLGVISAIRGDLPSAIAHFEAAVSLDPSYEEARRNLERARNAS